MAMSNAELEVALKGSLQRLVTALANKVAPDSLLLEGKSLAEITSLILAGKAATAGTADNALAVGGKDLTTIESERNAQLVAAIDALRIELEGDISAVTAETLGLGNVVNYGVATEEEALAGAADKYVTAMLAVKIAQVKIDQIVDAAPETLNTLAELSAALHDNPDIINQLMSDIGTNKTAIENLDTAVAAFEAKVLGYFDVAGNANNANLFAGKTLDEVLALARDGVDMSNVVLKSDDFGAYKLALTGDVEGVSLKERFEALVAADAAADGRLDAAEADLATKATSQALTDAVAALNTSIETLDSETDAALAQKVDIGGNIDTSTLTVGEVQVALSQVLVDLKAEIAATGSASDESIAQVQAALDAFIAAKATGAEAITGTDDAKYITSLALKAALDALDLSGKLDVTAQAADSAKLEGKTLAEIMAEVQGGEGSTGTTLSSLQAEVDAVEVRATDLEGRATAVEGRATAVEDRATDLEGRVTTVEGQTAALETGKLAVDAQAVDSAKLGGKTQADMTASSEEAAAALLTDKFVTPAAAKAAFDARWAEKVGGAPETLDTIEEIAAALRNNPDSLAAVETVAKQYTDEEVLAAIQQISGVDMVAGTTLASLYAQVVALQTSKLDATAQAVDSAKLQGKSLMEVIDAAVQPGRLFYPVVHVNGSLDDEAYVMPSPADVWADVKTNSVMEQVDTIYAIGVKRLLPGNLLNYTNQDGMTLRGAVSAAQEGPQYVIMRAGIEDTEWTVMNEPMLGCVARLSKHCQIVGNNSLRVVPGQTLFYNGFEALSDNVYYDWTMMADKEWEIATFTGTELVIDSARYHRSEIRIQSAEPVLITFNVETDLPYEMEMRFVNNTGVAVTFGGGNVVSVPRMEQYTMTKVNGVVRAVRYTNTAVAVAGDLDEAFFTNPDYVAPAPV